MSAKRRGRRIFFSVLLVAFVGILILKGFKYYQKIFYPSVKKDGYIYIPTGSRMYTLNTKLFSNGFIQDTASFSFVAELMEFDKVKPGKYKLTQGMSNKKLISNLRIGKQEPVDLTFSNAKNLKHFASIISRQIEADSNELYSLLTNKEFLKNYGYNVDNILCAFIPNTYEFYWNTNSEEFLERMKIEYNKFWTNEKEEKAFKSGLTKIETGILASIVQAETNHYDEMPIVAGVYINRLKRGWKLQADPTVRFLLDDNTRRVLYKDLEIDSPYNTYKYKGLPPGPLSLPSTQAINSVLNYQNHRFMYFCADPETGRHLFSKTHSQHVRNRKKYHDYLNRERIFR